MTLIGIEETGAARGQAVAPQLEVNVVYVNHQAALYGVREAARLAASLHARIRLVVPSVVPYPLPLTEPPVQMAHFEQCIQALASEANANISAEIFLCREYRDVARMLPKESLVIVAAQTTAWRFWSGAQRLGRVLAGFGHHVFFVDIGSARHA